MAEQPDYLDVSELEVVSFECPRCHTEFAFRLFMQGTNQPRNLDSLTRCSNCKLNLRVESEKGLIPGAIAQIQETFRNLRESKIRMGFVVPSPVNKKDKPAD